MARISILVVSLLLMGSCGGGSFTPHPGPLNGELTSGDESIGTISLTTTGNLVGGSGVLQFQGGKIVVSISGVIADKVINGTMSNASYGQGEFHGTFKNEERATGSFTFVSLDGENQITGSWVADLDY